MLRKLTLATVALLCFNFSAMAYIAPQSAHANSLNKEKLGDKKHSKDISKRQGRHCVKLRHYSAEKCHS